MAPRLRVIATRYATRSNRPQSLRRFGLRRRDTGGLVAGDASVPRTARPAKPRIRRILDDDPGAWWITCFAVDRRHRSIGVATALLDAAVAHAARNGATALEGHPVDTDSLQAERVNASALFTGTMRTFVACGFHEIGRTYPSRPVMRRDL